MKPTARRGRPPKSDARDGRAAILDAALDLFSENGYDATTVRQIGARIGVSDAALYSHFESKAAILANLFEIHGPKAVYNAAENLDLSQASADPKAFVRDALRKLAERWVQPAEHKFFRLLLMENLKPNFDDSLRLATLQAPLRARLIQLARWLITSGAAVKTDPEWLVTQFISPITSLRTDVALGQENHDLVKIKKQLDAHVEHFMRVFFPKF